MNGLFSKDNLIQIEKHYITSFVSERKNMFQFMFD